MIYLAYENLDYTNLTSQEIIDGILVSKLPEYIRNKAHGVDVRETLAQMTAMLIQLAFNNGMNLEQAQAWASQLNSKITKGQVTMGDLSQGLKETLSSGMVAVVGEGAVNTDNIVDIAVSREKIKDYAIGNTKIAPGAVTADKIAPLTITNANLALNSIERGNIKDGAIGNTKIVDKAVTGNKISDETVIESNLAKGAITKPKIADRNVSYKKTDFMKLADEINLFDGEFINFNLAGTRPLTYVPNPSTQHYAGILEIEQGKTYSIATNADYSGTLKAATAKSLKESGQLDGNYVYTTNKDNGISTTFTATGDDKYLYVDLYNMGFLKVVESENPVIPFVDEKYPIYFNQDTEKIVWFGDSISCLRKLPDRVENITGSKVYDVSIAGSTGSTHIGGLQYDGTSFVGLVDAVISGDWARVDASAELRNHWKNDENIKTLKSIDFNDIDKVVLFYGTNDYGGSANSLNTLRTGMTQSVDKLITAYPHLQFYFITPMYRTDWSVQNSQNLTLKAYVDEIGDISKGYGMPVYNAFENVGISEKNADYYLTDDGLHQNDVGDKLLGDKLSKFLLKF